MNKASGTLLLASAVTFSSAGQTVTGTTGPVDMAGFALNVKSLTLNGSVSGTGSLHGGNVDPSAGGASENPATFDT